MRKVLASRLFLSAGALVVSLVLAEGVFRFCMLRFHARDVRNFSHQFIEPAPGLYGCRLKPNLNQWVTTTKGPRRKSVRWHLTTDEHGLRISSDIKPRIPILAIGDSYTLGYALNDDATWPYFLEKKLNGQTKPETFRVFNAGVPGFNSTQEAHYLSEIMPIVKPRVVITGFVMNDADPPGWPELSPPSERFRGRSRSWIVAYLQSQKRKMSHYDYDRDYNPDSKRAKLAREALRSMSKRCREENAVFLVVIFPDSVAPWNENYSYTYIHRRVQEWGQEDGYQTLDLLPEAKSRISTGYRVKRDGHPNERAQNIFADAIARALLQRGLLPI